MVACLTKRDKLKLEKYFRDYIEDEQTCQMSFISLKKGVAIQMYDSRGIDLLSVDKKLLSFLSDKYKFHLIDENENSLY